MQIKHLLQSAQAPDAVTILGWVRTRRDAKAFSFLAVNDGSCQASLQVVVDNDTPGSHQLAEASTGSAVRIEGNIIPSAGSKQKWEMHASRFELVGHCAGDYPLQKKGHSMEFLRSIPHLRPRTNLFGAVFRIRSRMTYAIHHFFQQRQFVHIHSPIITTNDCEGAGEMFRVTTLNDKIHEQQTEDFFGQAAYLTVSGQLEGEAFASALGNIYTFGPTFRAENSHTSRHASEFWMIEPEMAFCDLNDNIDLAETFVQTLLTDALEHCEEDLAFCNQFVSKGLLNRLQAIALGQFTRMPYADAIDILKKSGRTFDYPVEFGRNLQAEHERFLAEEHCKGPVTVHDYPAAIKPFYMRRNDDGQTVAAIDLLLPGVGELIGGAQREERLDVLEKTMHEAGMPTDDYQWYLDLRRYGSVPHAGFGLGFERFLMFLTGVSNIRDTLPFPRTPGQAGP